MKKLLIAILLVIPSLLITCKVWDEDDTAGDQECIKYDKALNVSFTTTSTVDSVQFFMNGIQVCIPYDYTFFRENRGSRSFQGRFYNRQKIFACEVGTSCDNFEGDLNRFLIKVYSFDKMDSILLTRDGLAQLAYNKAYRVFPKSDSSFILNFEENLFTYTGYQGEFCIAELSSDSLLCLDAQSDSQKFERVCSGWSGIVY